MEEKKKEGKYIEIVLNGNVYHISYDGYQFRVIVNGSTIPKYPASLAAAISLILKTEHVAITSAEGGTLMDFANRYEQLVNQVMSHDFSLIQQGLKDNPIKTRTIETIAVPEPIQKVQAPPPVKSDLDVL